MMDVRPLLTKFRVLQEQRAETYAKFSSLFREFLQSRSEAVFQTVCADVTTIFTRINDEIRQIESALRGGSSEAQRAADVIRDIQTNERDNLHTTVQIQLIRRQLAFECEPDSHGHDNDDHSDGSRLDELTDVLHALLASHGKIITSINDSLDELRYLTSDMEEGSVTVM
eukprot:GILJ01011553.1.p1 GENE.GILJ01011553.1~~GILJ01011553.1.p1  ORF type:complete len:170 (-),score=21.10 GILJ01011553.1:123-632(-)